jgi:hypothetical protein
VEPPRSEIGYGSQVDCFHLAALPFPPASEFASFIQSLFDFPYDDYILLATIISLSLSLLSLVMAQTAQQKANASKAQQAVVARNQQALEPILVPALAPVPVPRLPARR